MGARMVAIVLFFGLVAPACSPVPALMKTVGTSAVVVSGAYRSLAAFDSQKLADVKALAQAGKPAEAEAMLNAYLPRYGAARKAVDAASVAVEGAAAAVPIVKLAKDPKAQAAQWITTITLVMGDLASACAAVGVKIPMVMK